MPFKIIPVNPTEYAVKETDADGNSLGIVAKFKTQAEAETFVSSSAPEAPSEQAPTAPDADAQNAQEEAPQGDASAEAGTANTSDAQINPENQP